jgi:phage-related protein
LNKTETRGANFSDVASRPYEVQLGRPQGFFLTTKSSCLIAPAYNFWYIMADGLKKLEVLFFRTERGNEPVREWLLSLEKQERKIIGDDVLKVQYCWPIGKPLVGSLGDGLWEVRSRLDDRIARVIFCVEGQTMVLLHGFVKKTQKTPTHELNLALRRKNQLL